MEQIVASGSAYCIGPRTNQSHKHSIPKAQGCTEPRISLTFRCIATGQKVRVVKAEAEAEGEIQTVFPYSHEPLTKLAPLEKYFRGFASVDMLEQNMKSCRRAGERLGRKEREYRVAQQNYIRCWGQVVDDLGVEVWETGQQRLRDDVVAALIEKGVEEEAAVEFVAAAAKRLKENVLLTCIGGYRYYELLGILDGEKDGAVLKKWLCTPAATVERVRAMVQKDKKKSGRLALLRELHRESIEEKKEKADEKEKKDVAKKEEVKETGKVTGKGKKKEKKRKLRASGQQAYSQDSSKADGVEVPNKRRRPAPDNPEPSVEGETSGDEGGGESSVPSDESETEESEQLLTEALLIAGSETVDDFLGSTRQEGLVKRRVKRGWKEAKTEAGERLASLEEWMRGLMEGWSK